MLPVRLHQRPRDREPQRTRLPCLAPAARKSPRARDVFVFMINGFKPHAPAAAMALIERLA